MKTVKMQVDIPLSTLAEHLVDEVDRGTLFRFILRLDELTTDWNFTTRLFKYFEEQMRTLAREIEDEKALNAKETGR